MSCPLAAERSAAAVSAMGSPVWPTAIAASAIASTSGPAAGLRVGDRGRADGRVERDLALAQVGVSGLELGDEPGLEWLRRGRPTPTSDARQERLRVAAREAHRHGDHEEEGRDAGDAEGQPEPDRGGRSALKSVSKGDPRRGSARALAIALGDSLRAWLGLLARCLGTDPRRRPVPIPGSSLAAGVDTVAGRAAVRASGGRGSAAAGATGAVPRSGWEGTPARTEALVCSFGSKGSKGSEVISFLTCAPIGVSGRRELTAEANAPKVRPRRVVDAPPGDSVTPSAPEPPNRRSDSPIVSPPNPIGWTGRSSRHLAGRMTLPVYWASPRGRTTTRRLGSSPIDCVATRS